MVDERGVVLNPLLRLRTKPFIEGVTGRSKDVKKITPALYLQRRDNFLHQLEELEQAPDTKLATHAGRVLMWARMDPESLAATHTPDDLFEERTGARLIAAWRTGYVVEFAGAAFNRLKASLSSPTDGQRCDIFRIEHLSLLSSALHEPDRIATAWEKSARDGSGRKLFNFRMPAFLSAEARDSVVKRLTQFALQDEIALPASTVRVGLLGYEREGSDTDSIVWVPAARFQEELQALAQAGRGLSLGLRNGETLGQLIASGAIVRWEPVVPVTPTTPGAGEEPDLALPPLDGMPVIGVIDGGYHANRYQSAVAWRLDPLVPDQLAARAHGNKVTSVVVDGHLWSNHLRLPQLHCRVGVVQAVPSQGAQVLNLDHQLLSYIERAFREHPETHVWNLSANVDRDCDDYDVSELGHFLARLARRYNKLLVISAGNRSNTERLAPPADCEAAIVVSGRSHDNKGDPAGPCPISRRGFGPEGMLKPETSWFSQHRVLGGTVERGTSYAAPLVSRLAAHTWQNLSEPNPDLVKALLISSCDLGEYSTEMGFGSPVAPELPWVCSSNAAVVAWTARISALRRYYWTGVRLPPSLLKGGRFVGKAKLVAVLDPINQIDGHNYMSTRLEAGLQYKKKVKGKLKNTTMLGPLNPNDRELSARTYDHKWDPVRVYSETFTAKNGPKFFGAQPELQVYARMYWRNQFLYAEEFMRQHEAQVSFVVALEADDPDANTYNEFRRIMAENVETALVEQDVTVEYDEDEEG